MNVWIISHYSRYNARQHDLCKYLVKQGHRVTIFASSFNHFSFKEEHLAPGESRKEEIKDGVTFVWLRTRAYRANNWRRAIGMLEFSVRSVFAGMFRAERPDVIIGTCVHMLAPIAAFLLAKFRRTAFVYELNDVWPQSLFESNFISPKSLMGKALLLEEKVLMKSAARVISILPHVGDRLSDIGIPPSKFVWIPNPVNPVYFDRIKPDDGVYSVPFNVMLITTFPARGINFDIVIEAARLLQESGNTAVAFTLVGSGPGKDRLERLATESGLTNIKFLGWIPAEQLQDTMNEASAFLVVANHRSIYRYGIAFNKLYACLMGERPIIFTSAIGNDPVKEANAGLTISPENPQAIVQAIGELMAITPEQRVAFGKNGKAYALKNHHIAAVSQKYEQMILDSVASKTNVANRKA
ncbi:MAG: glycosyltransferase family 4 protein [bacterium]|nr:glycosyltransferase family 4 protein [bacterium]